MKAPEGGFGRNGSKSSAVEMQGITSTVPPMNPNAGDRLTGGSRKSYRYRVNDQPNPARADAPPRTGALRILVLAPQPFFISRGTPIAVRAVVEALSKLGHHVDLLTLSQGEDVEIRNVTVHRVRRPPFVRHVPVGLSRQKVASDMLMLPTARRMLSRQRYDVIHGVEDGAIMAWLLSRWTGVPFVYDMDSHMSAQLREKSARLGPVASIVGYFERRAMKDATGILAVCPALVEIASVHQASERVALLPDMPLFDGEAAVPSDELLALGGIRIVYVGNLEHYQGIDLLLAGFRDVATTHPEARLVIVGGSEAHIARYSDQVRDLVDAGQVHFLGPRPLDQLGSILAGGDILVSPRLHGVNTPMKIYSYLESGRPVVATRLLTHTQVMDDSVAQLVEPSPGDLARGLEELLRDPERRRELGSRGREHVRREFGPARFETRLRDFYESVAERIGVGERENSELPASGGST